MKRKMTEKDAIEDLREAREQARKDQENAKEVSGLQTNLQRAMMDTSGASDSALIKAQQDLDGKLEEIAEDKYSKMLLISPSGNVKTLKPSCCHTTDGPKTLRWISAAWSA